MICRVLRLDWELARRGFARYAAYPAATLAGLSTNIVFGFMRGSVLVAMFALRADVGGYDVVATLTYVWLTQGLLNVVALWGWQELALRIRSGDIATDLIRPVNPIRAGLDLDLGRAAHHVLFRGIPPVLVGAIFFRVVLPASPLVWLAFAASIVLAVCVSFGFRVLYNLLAFWTGDSRGITTIAITLASLFSGFIVPLGFFPDWLRTIAHATPFPSMIQLPVDIFVGRATGIDLAVTLIVQLAWAAVLLSAAGGLFAVGTRRLVVQGG